MPENALPLSRVAYLTIYDAARQYQKINGWADLSMFCGVLETAFRKRDRLYSETKGVMSDQEVVKKNNALAFAATAIRIGAAHFQRKQEQGCEGVCVFTGGDKLEMAVSEAYNAGCMILAFVHAATVVESFTVLEEVISAPSDISRNNKNLALYQKISSEHENSLSNMVAVFSACREKKLPLDVDDILLSAKEVMGIKLGEGVSQAIRSMSVAKPYSPAP